MKTCKTHVKNISNGPEKHENLMGNIYEVQWLYGHISYGMDSINHFGGYECHDIQYTLGIIM